MKTTQLILILCFAAVIIGLAWEAARINELRAEVAELRKDLRVSAENAFNNATNLSSQTSQERRDNLELIKLRNQVRDLKEDLVAAHAIDPKTGLRAAINVLMPEAAASKPWKFRSEWRGMETHASNQYVQVMATLKSATNEFIMFLSMDRPAKMSLAVGRTEDARRFATDMMVLDDKFSRGVPEKSNGDVVYNGNLVLGRIALDEGRTEDAKRHLLAAGASNGSPVLNSFGPNMSLAKELLAKGDQETVLQYLELCRKFWNNEKLNLWIKDIHEGRIPEFGGNLLY